MQEANRLAEALLGARTSILVVTGAGVSHASGISTFRGSDPGAVWKTSDIEMATWSYFQSDPVGQWRWYLDRFHAIDSATPNPAHDALAQLESWQNGRGGGFLLVTQNIDTLHEAAGSKQLIKVHGSSDKMRCIRPGCRSAAPSGSVARVAGDMQPFRERPGLDTLPRCPDCGDIMRVHVLFFDEHYQQHDDYRFREVVEAGEKAEVLLFVGTSFAVGITDILLRAAYERRTPAFSVDPAGSRAPAYFEVHDLALEADKLLPRVIDVLTG